MPFEPTRPSRDADSLVSPELEALADQLRQDAQWLVSRYPAHKPQLPLKKRNRLRWVAMGAAAALLVLAVDAWWMWSRPASSTPAADNIAAAEHPAPAVKVPGPKQRPLSATAPTAAVPGTPGVSYSDLSGAEKEAILDLLEERAPALNKPSLSL